MVTDILRMRNICNSLLIISQSPTHRNEAAIRLIAVSIALIGLKSYFKSWQHVMKTDNPVTVM